MAVTKVCCTCLSFDVEMLSLTDDDIRECLEKVVTFKIDLENKLLQNVCKECVLLLRKFVQFQQICIEANQRLRQMLKQSPNLTKDLVLKERQELYSKTMIDFDNQHQKVEFSDESESKNDLENTDLGSESIDSEKVGNQTLEANRDEGDLEDVMKPPNTGILREYLMEISKSEPIFENTPDSSQTGMESNHIFKEMELGNHLLLIPHAKKYESDIQIDSVRSEWSDKVEDQTLETNEDKEDLKDVKESSGKETMNEDQGMKTPDSETNYAVGIVPTKKQKIQGLLKEMNSAVKIVCMFECKVCGEKFENEQIYRKHVRTAHPTQYVCGLCKEHFTHEHHLERHQRFSKECGKRSTMLQCERCDQRFNKFLLWFNHMMGHEILGKGEPPPTKCLICGHKTTSWHDWKYHVCREHGRRNTGSTFDVKKQDKAYMCELCEKSFSDSGSQADIGSNIGIMETNAEPNAINISETNQSSRPSDKFGKKNPAKRTFQEDSVTEAEDQMLNDAIELVRKHNNTEDDPYVAFGMHVAAELRKYDNITFTQIKHSINNILYEADMTYLSQQTSARYHNENRPGYFTSHLADLSDSSASNNSGLTQLIHDLDT